MNNELLFLVLSAVVSFFFFLAPSVVLSVLLGFFLDPVAGLPSSVVFDFGFLVDLAPALSVSFPSFLVPFLVADLLPSSSVSVAGSFFFFLVFSPVFYKNKINIYSFKISKVSYGIFISCLFLLFFFTIFFTCCFAIFFAFFLILIR